MPIMKQNRFWSFEVSSASKHGRFDLEQADRNWLWSVQTRLRHGSRLDIQEWPSPAPIFTYKKVNVFEDIPWSIGSDIYMVSDRLRTILEVEAPGAAEYLPVRLDGPRIDELPAPYWAMNWVRVFDCLDEESMDIDQNGKRFVQIPVIDTARIPADGVLGLVKGYEVVRLIRNDLKLKLEKAGITGAQFTRIAQVDRSPSLSPKTDSTSRSKLRDRPHH